jgi:TatA/E family protein of Tat protein translocase
MFGTLGFSELILILVIILIIFGAGRLPQIGEGIGKALKGFKKEVNEPAPPVDPETAAQSQAEQAQPSSQTGGGPAPTAAPEAPRPTAPYQPGPELTPGTTAALMASAAPQVAQPRPKATPSAPASPGAPPAAVAASATPPTMEDRAASPPPSPRGVYPPVPKSAQPKAPVKRPSAVVNKDAVARVQAQQAAMRAAAGRPKEGQDPGLSSQDLQSLGEGLGDTLRTFRQAAADVRNAVDPEMRTIRAELDAAQKEVQQSIEAAKEMPAVAEDSPEKA